MSSLVNGIRINQKVVDTMKEKDGVRIPH